MLTFGQHWRALLEQIRGRLHTSEEGLSGLFVALPEPRLVEFWAASGFSFIIIDFEHATISLEEADHLIKGAVYAGIAPLVRAVPTDRQLLFRALDSGAVGIVVPDVRSPAEVSEWTRAISYPPAGTRGLAAARCNDWGAASASDASVLRPLLVPMIESTEAVNAAHELLAEDDADWFHIGLADLGMRIRAASTAPSLSESVKRIAEIAEQQGAALGMNYSGKGLLDRLPPTVRCLATTDRTILHEGANLCKRSIDDFFIGKG